MLFERTLCLGVRACLVTSGSCIECGALLLEPSEDTNWTGPMTGEIMATLYVTRLNLFHRHLMLFWDRDDFFHHMVHDILHEAPWLCHECRFGLVV
jgi:hypothetical protein